MNAELARMKRQTTSNPPQGNAEAVAPTLLPFSPVACRSQDRCEALMQAHSSKANESKVAGTKNAESGTPHGVKQETSVSCLADRSASLIDCSIVTATSSLTSTLTGSLTSGFNSVSSSISIHNSDSGFLLKTQDEGTYAAKQRRPDEQSSLFVAAQQSGQKQVQLQHSKLQQPRTPKR